jgi:O-antigen/teichoic acid export membrane protein
VHDRCGFHIACHIAAQFKTAVQRHSETGAVSWTSGPPANRLALSSPQLALMRLGRRALNHNRALEAMLIGAQAAGLLGAIVIARSVGPAGRGTLVTLTVWGQILGLLAGFSLDRAIVVLTSGKNAVASPDEAFQAVRLPVVATSCLAIIASVFLGRHFFSSGWLIAALAALAVATAQAELIAGWLLATGRRQAYITWRLAQPALYLTTVIAAALLLGMITVADRTVVMGVGAAASMVVPVIFVLGYLLRRPRAARRGMAALLRFGGAAHIANILQYLNGRLDLLALTFLVSVGGLGYYSAGAAVGQAAMLMASAGVLRGITGEAKRTDLVGIGIAAILSGAVILASPMLVPMLFGASFEPAVPIARILAIGAVANYALQGVCGRLLGRRQPWMVALSQGVGLIVFAIGIAAFHTLQGVAWSSVVSFTVSLVVAQVALRQTAQR